MNEEDEDQFESRNGTSTCNADELAKLLELRLQGKNIHSSITDNPSRLEPSLIERDSKLQPSVPAVPEAKNELKTNPSDSSNNNSPKVNDVKIPIPEPERN